MNEHRKEAEQNEEKRFTRSTQRAAETNINKSAITDHVRRQIISLTGRSP